MGSHRCALRRCPGRHARRTRDVGRVGTQLHSYGTGTNIYFTFAGRPDNAGRARGSLLRASWRAAMEATLAAGGTISHHHGIGRVRRDWLPMELGSAYPLLARRSVVRSILSAS